MARYGSPESHVRGRKAIAAAWPIVTGAEATLPELQIAGAQAQLESAYGHAPYKNKVTGELRVINNWGAQQCGHGPPCGADCFEVSDTHEDGTQYNYCYAVFPQTPDGDAQAAEFYVKAITLRRPSSWEHMKRGDIDAWTMQMRSRDLQTGVGVYFEEKFESRAHGIEQRVLEIAGDLGEPVTARRGGPVVDVATGASPAIEAGEAATSSAAKAGIGGLLVGLFVLIVRHVWGSR